MANDLDIAICMGSSCFARGNNRNIELLRDLMKGGQEPYARCKVVGHLCQDRCNVGPNLDVNGTAYREVDPVSLMVVLNHHLAPAAEERAGQGEGEKGPGPKAQQTESVPSAAPRALGPGPSPRAPSAPRPGSDA